MLRDDCNHQHCPQNTFCEYKMAFQTIGLRLQFTFYFSSSSVVEPASTSYY